MKPEELKLPKLDRESFHLSEPSSRFAFPFPFSIVAIADPAPILQFLEPGEVREVVAAYAHYQAASAQAAVELYKNVEQIAAGKTAKG